VGGVSRAIDRIEVTFDDETLVADAGLIVPATLMVRLGLEALIDEMVRLVGRVGGALPGRKVLTLLTSCAPARPARCCRSGSWRRRRWGRSCGPSASGTSASWTG
jgi:hypothetical protein